ncbi:MFS transporter [Rhizobium sp. BR 315]|uniref:MFS transporter n=1 Tax=Rhizobium sp. BR 315 TaxID=3040014 RepID=UPI003D34849A
MSVIKKSQPMSAGEPAKALWTSTFAFTICFAVWTIFAIIGIRIKQELGLNETEFGLLVGTPVLTGSVARILLGIWTERYGGRLVYTLTMMAAAVATILLSYATTYTQMLIAGLGVGLAGGSFAVGIAYISPFFPSEKQGTALGIFGAGNVGAAVTKFAAPFVLIAWGWQAVAEIWALVLAVTAIVFWFTTTDDPAFRARRDRGVASRSLLQEFAPLKNVQVWRFSLYYFFAFGGFVALSLWLPRYLVGAYGFNLEVAGMVAAAYSIPGSVFRAFGGVLSDKKGARSVMYAMLAVSAVATLVLSVPAATPTSPTFGITPAVFVVVIFVLGFFMSLGKAAVFKHIPAYYPESIGAVGGIVGMMGGLGGFILPIVFGLLKDITGLWSSCFLLLFAIVAISLVWMHLSVRQIERRGASTPVVATT